MDFQDSYSDLSVLDRLFNRTFSEYWSLYWKDYDFNKYNSVKPELDEALKLFPYPSFTQSHQSDSDDFKCKNDKDQPEFSKRIEKDRQNKLNVTEELQLSLEVLTLGSESMDLISRNEELDEIHTQYLKYLMLPYMYAHVMLEKPDLSNRFSILKKVQIYFNQFMNTLSRMDILRLEEKNMWDNEKQLKPEDGRNRRINQASYENSLKKTISQVFYSSGSPENFMKFNNDEDSEREELYRNTLLDLLKLFSIQTLNHLNSIKIELPFLELREVNKTVFSKDQRNDKPTKPWFLHIDSNSKLDPSVVQSLYKKMVFLPGHNLPTISLDECARIEMEMDVNTIGKVKNVVKKKDSSDLLVDKLDDEEESDKSSECTEDEREWDDWKDDHPKGQGNKDVNIG